MTNKNSKGIVFNFAWQFSILLRPVVSFAILLGIFAFCIFAVNAANAATIYFSPSSGNFTVGNILNTSVLVNTQGEAINNSGAVINFPTNLLEVISISKSGSIFTLWVEEPSFSNSAGAISFDGGLPTPGYNGSAGRLLNITFRVKNAGTASLVFSSGAVRANDGYGTDILQTREQAQFNLILEEKPIAPLPSALGAPQAPRISSPTHPDSNKWYALKDAKFTWELSGTTGARLLVGRTPNVIPTVTYIPAISSRELNNLDDGIWYFSVQLRNNAGWGGTSHFKFQIDATNPSRYEIELVPREDLTERKVGFIFDASDETSGISHYEIEIDDRAKETWVDDGSGIYTTPPLQPGTHILIARAVDKAGNFLTNSTTFTIEETPFFKYSDLMTTYLSTIIPILALIVLILLLVWHLLRKYREHKGRMRKEIQEAEKSIHEAFDSLREDVREQIGFLEKLETVRRLSEEEDKIMNQLKKDLDSAEKIISKEVEDIDKEEG